VGAVLRRALPAAVLALTWALAPAAAAGLVLEPCRLPGVETEARCGTLARPLDPARPEGRQIELHVAVLPALARRPRADPVFFVPGGPGQGAIALAGQVQRLLAPLARQRDLVLVDPRGTGASAPLDCGTAPDALAGVDAQVEHLRACREALARAPFLGGADDLRHFNTAAKAADLDAVRRALGAAQVNVVAVSYGTRVALELMRQQPGAVRRAVLDGVVPPDMALPRAFALDAQAALDALFDACARDAACAGRHPRLAARWAQALARLPASVVLPDPLTGAAVEARITRETALGALRLALYSPLLGAALPWAIDEAAHGRWAALLGLARALAEGPGQPRLAAGAHFSVICSEDLSTTMTPAVARSPFDALAVVYDRVCADWPRAAPPPGFTTIATARAPVLLLSGGIDPVTPPRHGERVHAALGARARHAVVPQAGHGVLALPCVREAVAHFITERDPERALAVDADCARGVPRPPVWAPPGAAAAGEPR
jgi:pimeloyl-ACP methyl ester carboxylesterase